MRDSAICRHCGHPWLAHEQDQDQEQVCGIDNCGCKTFEKMEVIRLWGGRYAEIVDRRMVRREYEETTPQKEAREARGIPKPKPLEYSVIITKKIPNLGYLMGRKKGGDSSL